MNTLYTAQEAEAARKLFLTFFEDLGELCHHDQKECLRVVGAWIALHSADIGVPYEAAIRAVRSGYDDILALIEASSKIAVERFQTDAIADEEEDR